MRKGKHVNKARKAVGRSPKKLGGVVRRGKKVEGKEEMNLYFAGGEFCMLHYGRAITPGEREKSRAGKMFSIRDFL